MGEQLTNRAKLLGITMNLSTPIALAISNLIGPYKDKQARCGEVYEVFKGCKSEADFAEILKAKYGIEVTPDPDWMKKVEEEQRRLEEENEEETDIP